MVPVLLQADQKKAGAEVSASAAPADEITLGEIYHSSIGNNPLWAPDRKGPEQARLTFCALLGMVNSGGHP
jgi:hypothetical protein